MNQNRVKQLVKSRRVFDVTQKICDRDNLPYPPELVAHLTEVLKYRSVD